MNHFWVRFIEDFKTEDAFRILDHMRHKVLCFNDDIQGTGATILAGLINALRAQGTPTKDARIIFFGAEIAHVSAGVAPESSRTMSAAFSVMIFDVTRFC